MPQPNPQIAAMAAEAAKRGLSLEAYMRMMQGPAGILQQPAVQMPAQRPFQQGYGPGGQVGAGQGQQAQQWGPSQFSGGQATGIGAQVSPAGYAGPEGPPAPEDTSIWGQIKSRLGMGAGPASGVVPFGQRLGNIGAILGAASDPHGRALAPTLAAVNEQYGQQQDVADQKAAYYAEQDRMRAMAENLYENLKDTNPQMAEMIRSDPSLVKEYMKGTLDIEQEKVKQGLVQDREMAVERYKSEHDPKTLQLNMEKDMWKDFVVNNELENASTADIYRKYYDDPDLTPNEAKRIASARMRGQKEADDMYSKVIDDRSKTEENTLAKEAAALAGVTLKPGQRIKNRDEVIASGGKVPPILEWAEGTEEAAAAQTKEKNVQFAADNTVNAIDRVQENLLKQETGESLTGGGVTGVLGPFPGPHTAGDIYDDLTVIRSNLGFEQLQKLRDQSPGGGALGPVSDYENKLLQGTVESLNQTRDPKVLSARLYRLRKIYSATMTPSKKDPSKSVLKSHSEMLISDPSPEARAEFDEVYGAGAADAVLSGQGAQ